MLNSIEQGNMKNNDISNINEMIAYKEKIKNLSKEELERIDIIKKNKLKEAYNKQNKLIIQLIEISKTLNKCSNREINEYEEEKKINLKNNNDNNIFNNNNNINNNYSQIKDHLIEKNSVLNILGTDINNNDTIKKKENNDKNQNRIGYNIGNIKLNEENLDTENKTQGEKKKNTY